MSTQFDATKFKPELVSLMREAFALARQRVELPDSEIERAHAMMAGAIIEWVGAGERDREVLASAALASLSADVGAGGASANPRISSVIGMGRPN